VAAVPDATGLAATVDATDPDVLITDVRLPPTFTDEGLRAAVALRARRPALPVLVLSQYVEQTYAAELLDSDPGGDGAVGGVGYLLKDRIGDVEEFVGALERVVAGHTVVDPYVVRQLLGRRKDPLHRLTPREREVLGLMAEGRSNAAIARRMVITEAAVAKHISGLLTKLDLPPDADDHRRVRAVLAYLRGQR
jgi:DNA-binding NarL/FixJ family response regulator